MFCYFCVKQQHSDLCNYFVIGKHKIKGFQMVYIIMSVKVHDIIMV